MNVQELIDILLKIEDKGKEVWLECYDWCDDSYIRDALIVYSLDNLPKGIIISNDLENKQEEDNRIVYGEYRKEQK